jgi:hypothetical protein
LRSKISATSDKVVLARRPEPQRAPHIVNRDLPHPLNPVLQQVLPQDVAIEVGSELTGLGIGDPGEPVGLGGFDARGTFGVELGARLDEEQSRDASCRSHGSESYV